MTAHPRTSVDQQTIRRRQTGLIASDPSLVFPGYTLFTPMFGDGRVFLIDLDGSVAHEWSMPMPPGLWSYRLDNGNLLYLGKPPDPSPRFEAWDRFRGGAVMEVDWEGRILWEVRHPDHHHDARLLRNGNVLLLCLEPIPPELAARVRGGIPGTEAPGGLMYADVVREMTKAGEVVWEWHAWEHLDPEIDIITPQDHRAEWSHGNTVDETPDGNVLVSFRNISTIAIVDRRTGAITWKLGPELLAQQHQPRVLDNGNILVFDNGTHRRRDPRTYSRVLEIDPATKQPVWTYQDQPVFNFYSAYISGAQRLPNGNTLIVEGITGRLFEVTREGAVVWEYINPYFGVHPSLGANNWVFRAQRYPYDAFPRARPAPSQPK